MVHVVMLVIWNLYHVRDLSLNDFKGVSFEPLGILFNKQLA